MLKKITCSLIALCMAFTLIIPVNAYAKTNPISSDTVITEDNIYNVLKYLNIDLSNFKKTDVNGSTIHTVGDLQNAIVNTNNSQKNTVSDTSLTTNNINYLTTAYTINGTKMLYRYLNCDSYTVEYSAAGQYSWDQWTGVGSANISANSNSDTIAVKIESKNVSANWYPDHIAYSASAVIDIYAGIDNIGLILINKNSVSSTQQWGASYIPYTPPTYPGYYIQYGSTGSNVVLVQSRLNYLGFNCGNADGDFGSMTKSAVINFQRSKGLTADGVVGPSTWSYLFARRY